MILRFSKWCFGYVPCLNLRHLLNYYNLVTLLLGRTRRFGECQQVESDKFRTLFRPRVPKKGLGITWESSSA